jgi:hypothetical protein
MRDFDIDDGALKQPLEHFAERLRFEPVVVADPGSIASFAQPWRKVR